MSKNKEGKEKNSVIKEINTAFIVINNYEKVNKNKGITGKNPEKKDNFEGLPNNFQYLIISKEPVDKAFTYEITIRKENNTDNNNKIGKNKNKKMNKQKSKKEKNNNININNEKNDTPSNLNVNNSPINKKKKERSKNKRNI